jgi:hypothetical protein
MSFGFMIPEGGEKWNGRVRELVAIDLREISVVHAFPAYDATEVAARSNRADQIARLVLERLRVSVM